LLFFGVKILKFFDEDPGSGMETVRIRDPGWKKIGSGIREKHPGSATLVFTNGSKTSITIFQAIAAEKRDDKKIFRDLEEGFEKARRVSSFILTWHS
jgi:hypothetical protein